MMSLKPTMDFLTLLAENNNREWFAENKQKFQEIENIARTFFNEMGTELQKRDSIEGVQVYRIYRDVRFSKDKSPYKKYLGAWYSRTKPFYRGSYYLHLEPGNSFIEGGFWNPNADDLKRIRKEFELDDSEIRTIIRTPNFVKYFNGIDGEELKSAPKDFDKAHKAIDLIRKKQFLIVRRFTDTEILDKDFKKEVLKTFTAMRPYFDYMSDVLTTNLNGESIIE